MEDTKENNICTEKGHWTLSKIKDEAWGGWWYRYTCSVCSHTSCMAESCCSNCGAKMEKVVTYYDD